MATAATKPTTADKRSVAARWGRTNTDAGWTAMPTVLFQRQQALGLDALDLNIILHLLGPWWEADRFPYLTVQRMADAIGVSARTIQRRITELQKCKYIKRVPRSKDGRSLANVYDLSGLVKACEPFSKEALQDREQRRKEAVARSTRKKPKGLTVIPGGKT